MSDRVFDLFVGYYNSDGFEEASLTAVIMANISFKFFLEILISILPLMLSKFYYPPGESKSMTYLMCKLIRYLRLFEMDG